MNASDAAGWKLENFTEWLEIWEKNEPSSAISVDRRLAVLEWIFSRYTDPYAGARREDGFDNYWFAKVPWTAHDGQVVVCAYWIFEVTQTVRCDQISTLGEPV